MADWLQYVCGYASTGFTDEHLLLFLYGEGGTGKGTFLSAIANALGDYARRIDPDDLMEGRGEQHPAWLADLQGRRMVVGDEIPRGRRWNTGRVNALVSAEPLRSRHMRQGFFEFKPSAQVILAGNHAPTVQSRSTGLSRRLVVVPFDKTPTTVLKNLLREIDLGVVLSWIAEGAKRYFQDGLPGLPAEVERATSRYHDTADPFAPFVEELPRDTWFPRPEVWTRYTSWSANQGIGRPLNRGQVLATLREDYGCEERVIHGQRQIRVGQLHSATEGTKVQGERQSLVNTHTRACEDKQEIDTPDAPFAPHQRLAMVAAVLTGGDGDTNALPDPTPADVAATAERVRAVLGDRSLDDLTANAKTAAADALANLLEDADPLIRTAARRLRDGGDLKDDDYLVH